MTSASCTRSACAIGTGATGRDGRPTVLSRRVGSTYDVGAFGLAMPLYTADALILRTYRLGESDRIVVFLTRDRGKKRGVAKNARQSRRRFGGALEPMTCGRVAYQERERRDLVQLQYVEILRSPLSAPGAEALGFVSYFAELIDEWAQDADPSETLYRLGASVVDALVEGVPPARLARYFEYWMLRLQGVYAPAPDLSGDALAFLDAAREASPSAIGRISVSARTLGELEAAHRTQIAHHLERDLRSLRVLREMGR
jgi:recombinational DNA repair protein (RecF pathway)